MVMKMKGIHCHESQIIMSKRAAHGSADHTQFSSPKPRSSGSNGPLVFVRPPSSSHSTDAKRRHHQGMKKITRKEVLAHDGLRAQEEAIEVPMTNCSAQPTMT